MTGEQVLTAEQMAECDRHTIEDIGLPSLVLMERAALAATDVIVKQMSTNKVLVVCGVGNNGGDGLAVARLLWLKGIPVTVVLIGNPEKATAQTKTQLKVCQYYGITILEALPELDTYTTIVDAIFGIGLSRSVTGKFATVIEQLNAAAAGKLAIDIASGISANAGTVLGTAFKADVTVTMAYQKIGQTIAQGPAYNGDIIVADIGIYQDDHSIEG
ncbi:NAD(P)H-hydrate epimerase [Agrilactobacillus yilanensis]|uniref:NAD(P)H-hydrate epimerase n=1 Tax=Agrilactobacillus yilanensis TaxID=2485997 RepID=A0ABW4J6G7_9LACO|nr:NAD(P)H-hydrate epimerase [Agrilactobacillus yilanensis]